MKLTISVLSLVFSVHALAADKVEKKSQTISSITIGEKTPQETFD